MSASNTAHVPMDEPHLSRYGANAARALELEGAVRPGTVAREMRRALAEVERARHCLLYTSPSPRDRSVSRMPSSA